MAADEDFARVAAVFGDVLHRPGEGRGGIVDVGGVFDLRAQTIVRRDDRDASLGEAFTDFGAIFRTQILGAVLHAAAVEPHISGEALGSGGDGQVEFAAFLLVGRQGYDVVLIRDILNDLGLDRRR